MNQKNAFCMLFKRLSGSTSLTPGKAPFTPNHKNIAIHFLILQKIIFRSKRFSRRFSESLITQSLKKNVRVHGPIYPHHIRVFGKTQNNMPFLGFKHCEQIEFGTTANFPASTNISGIF